MSSLHHPLHQPRKYGNMEFIVDAIVVLLHFNEFDDDCKYDHECGDNLYMIYVYLIFMPAET